MHRSTRAILVLVLASSAPIHAAQAQGSLPKDSLERARLWTRLFTANKVDSLWGTITPTPSGPFSSRDNLAQLLGRFAEQSGGNATVTGERWIWRGGNRQYWATLSLAGQPEDLVIRWVMRPDGTFGGFGLNPVGQSPPIDSAGPSSAPTTPPPAADTAGVRRAALDYLEGFYEGDTTKLVRSVRTDVSKLGFGRGATGYAEDRMTWPQFLSYASSVKAGLASGRPARPAVTADQVQLLDLLDQTAATKVTAWWGTDYLLMARSEGRWMITHVLWQSAPPRR